MKSIKFYALHLLLTVALMSFTVKKDIPTSSADAPKDFVLDAKRINVAIRVETQRVRVDAAATIAEARIDDTSLYLGLPTLPAGLTMMMEGDGIQLGSLGVAQDQMRLEKKTAVISYSKSPTVTLKSTSRLITLSERLKHTFDVLSIPITLFHVVMEGTLKEITRAAVDLEHPLHMRLELLPTPSVKDFVETRTKYYFQVIHKNDLSQTPHVLDLSPHTNANDSEDLVPHISLVYEALKNQDEKNDYTLNLVSGEYKAKVYREDTFRWPGHVPQAAIHVVAQSYSPEFDIVLK